MNFTINKTYVEFFYQKLGFFEKAEEVKYRDVNKIKVPKDCYGFKFYDQTLTFDEGDIHPGIPENFSGMFYIGKIKTLDDIKHEIPNSALQKIMEANKWDKVVRIKTGEYKPFLIEDILLREK